MLNSKIHPGEVGFFLGLLLAAASLPAKGDITYHLNFNPENSPEEQQVANSVAVAAAFYNQHGSFNKHWSVGYNPGIPTAQANINGDMGFGGKRNERVVFHEAAHTFGMGTHWAYGGLLAGGVWQGKYGNQAQFDTYNAYADGLHGDGHAIWPSGFNYDNEDGYINRIWHTRIMAGMRADLGYLSFTREPFNEAVVAGETAEFRIVSPMASSWQWQKDGVNLTNGGDISGANTATLRVANAEAGDAGSYRCVATGAGETLNSRPRQLWVHAAPQLGQWDFNSNATDSVGANHGTAHGLPLYVAGKTGQAVDLDGIDDYIDLPDAVGRLDELTIATWVNWDGGNNWQRVFDFGTGTDQYLFLTPKSGGNTMRLALKDVINGRNVEYQVNTTVLPTGQWVHLAVVLKGGYMTLYVNGQAKGSVLDLGSSPAGFPATNNYIGKSQFADPLFNGRIDDFRVYGKAFSGAEIWSLWGQSANQAPVFNPTVITLPPVSAIQPFTGQTLAPYASDPESNPLTFTKAGGPSWLSVAANGALSGQPGPGTGGLNTFLVRVADPAGASADATLQVQVTAPPAAPVTASTSAPVPDGDDASFLPGGVAESDTIGGTAVSGDNDESTYVAEDRTSKGQTFTTGPNASGYTLHAFTFQHVNWPSSTAGATFYDVYPGDQWEIEVGTMNGSVKTPFFKYAAAYDSAHLIGSGNSGTGQFLTFNLSGLGVHLAPNTTHYVEIAPLSGGCYFELNSSRNGTYAGGTAFRGNTAGTLGTAVNLLAGDFAFHADLKPRIMPSASTVAYWNFEEGSGDAYVPYPRSTAGRYVGSILDRSGKGHHLSPHAANWHWYRSLVPGATTPRSGAGNTRSIQNGNAFPAISSIGTPLSIWSPTAWTIEAAIRPDDATNGWQTFIGRDSQGAFAAEPALAALYFQITPTGALQIRFTDAAGNNWVVTSAANVIQDAKWHAVAATSDGSMLSLYRKNITNGDVNYTLLGTTNISASADPAISSGSGDGGDWDPGVFSVARGLYNGGHSDRFFGHLDDIRFSDGALTVADFLYTPPPLTPAQSWRQTYFSMTSNTGNAADDADPDNDGVVNLLERAFGGNPTIANGGILPAISPTGQLLTIVYTRAKGFPDLTLTVQESSNDTLSSWVTAVGTEVVTDLGGTERVEFTVDPGTTGRKLLRVQANQFP